MRKYMDRTLVLSRCELTTRDSNFLYLYNDYIMLYFKGQCRRVIIVKSIAWERVFGFP